MTQSKKLLLILTISAIVFQDFPKPIYAQISEFKLTASDGAERDLFGHSVSISGDYVVVGAFADDDNGFNSGSAYVFKRTDTFWTEEAKLLPSDGTSEMFFGESVSISGDYIVVGATGDRDNGRFSGSAYIFNRNETSWLQESKLLPSDGAEGDQFGQSVSISGDYAVVGAPSDNDNGDRSGSAYVFKRDSTSWTEEAKLLPSDGAAFDEFGWAVSISGDLAVVTAVSDDENGINSGSAYVFKRTGTSWIQEAKLLASDGEAGDQFGFSISISDDYVIVGSRLDDDNGDISGSAYVFKRSNTIWVQQAKLLPSDGAEGDLFGWAVSISGNYAAVGADSDDDNGINSGSVYVFKRTGTSWIQEAKLLPSDGAEFDQFGQSVSISGDYAVVGAESDDDNGSAAGSAYIFSGFASPVGIESIREGLPAEYSLSQNYPNPFNPETVIEYLLPQSGEVLLAIYNLRGEEVAQIVKGHRQAGTHQVNWDASSFASGIYFYRLQAGDFVLTRKMVLLK